MRTHLHRAGTGKHHPHDIETAAREALPAEWPVDGTTGYDALAEVSSLFVDPAAEDIFDSFYRDLTGDQRDFAAHVEAGKRMIATGILQAEIRRLARLAKARGMRFGVRSDQCWPRSGVEINRK